MMSPIIHNIEGKPRRFLMTRAGCHALLGSDPRRPAALFGDDPRQPIAFARRFSTGLPGCHPFETLQVTALLAHALLLGEGIQWREAWSIASRARANQSRQLEVEKLAAEIVSAALAA